MWAWCALCLIFNPPPLRPPPPISHSHMREADLIMQELTPAVRVLGEVAMSSVGMEALSPPPLPEFRYIKRDIATIIAEHAPSAGAGGKGAHFLPPGGKVKIGGHAAAPTSPVVAAAVAATAAATATSTSTAVVDHSVGGSGVFASPVGNGGKAVGGGGEATVSAAVDASAAGLAASAVRGSTILFSPLGAPPQAAPLPRLNLGGGGLSHPQSPLPTLPCHPPQQHRRRRSSPPRRCRRRNSLFLRLLVRSRSRGGWGRARRGATRLVGEVAGSSTLGRHDHRRVAAVWACGRARRPGRAASSRP